MKTPEKSNKPDASKQKKQILALGGLSAVFIAVLAIQFGGGESAPQASAMTAPTATPADGTTENASAEAAPEGVPIPVAKENEVLAAPASEAVAKRSPFTNFWNVTPTGTTAPTAQLAAPNITLNATMPSDTKGLAVIDGELHFVGDSIHGWALAAVSPRSVTLQAPAGETVVVDMPLLVGRVSLPEMLGAGPETGMVPVPASPTDG